MRRILITVLITSICFYVAAFFLEGTSSSILVELGTTALEIVIALVIVERLSSRNQRKDAVHGFLSFIIPCISDFHNHLMRGVEKQFGDDDYNDLVMRYMASEGRPTSLRPEEREKLYQLVKGTHATIMTHLNALDQDLMNLVLVLGWSYDSGVLKTAFSVRSDIASFRKIQVDDSDDAKIRLCRYILDIDLQTEIILNMLMKHGDIDPNTMRTKIDPDAPA